MAISSVGGGAAGSVAGGVPAFLAAVLGGVLLPLAARAGGPRRRPCCRLFAGGPVAGASLLWPALFELASPARRCSLRAPCSPCGRLVVRVPVLSRRCAVHRRRCAGVRFLLAVRLVCTWGCGGGLLLPVPPAGGVPFAARALCVGGPHAGRLHLVLLRGGGLGVCVQPPSRGPRLRGSCGRRLPAVGRSRQCVLGAGGPGPALIRASAGRERADAALGAVALGVGLWRSSRPRGGARVWLALHHLHDP